MVREFEARHGVYSGEPAVLLLDRTVVRVFPGGARIQLTHNIIRVLTKEGISFEPSAVQLVAREGRALNETLGYQQKIKAQNEMLQQAAAAKNGQNSAVMGAGQMPSDGAPAAPAPAPAPAPVAPPAPSP